MMLDPYNQTDHPECKSRPDSGLSAITELDPGYITGTSMKHLCFILISSLTVCFYFTVYAQVLFRLFGKIGSDGALNLVLRQMRLWLHLMIGGYLLPFSRNETFTFTNLSMHI